MPCRSVTGERLGCSTTPRGVVADPAAPVRTSDDDRAPNLSE